MLELKIAKESAVRHRCAREVPGKDLTRFRNLLSAVKLVVAKSNSLAASNT